MSTIMAAWSVTYVVHSTLLVALVWAASHWIRSASARDTLWKIALIGGIVTATLQVAAPIDRVVPQSAPRRITMQMPAPAAAPVDKADTAKATPQRKTADIPVVPIAWSLAAALLLARIFLGRKRFLAAIGERVEILRGADRTLLDGLASAAGIRRPVRLTESDGVRSPVAMLGWEIVIPTGVFARLSEEQRETILAHELAHLLRRDPLWLTIAETLKALLFFQPLNWLVQARMKETAEFLCDDAAVLQTGNQKALAETLAELATSVAMPVPAVAAMAEGGSNLIVRVTRVLRSHPTSPLRLHLRLAIALCIVVITAAFAPGMAVVSASVANIEKGTSHFADGLLERSFDGPEGKTRVKFEAKNATLTPDGKSISFDDRGGYLHAVQTSARGPRREVDVTSGRDGNVYRYRVDGVEKAWCEDARLVLVAAFTGEAAYTKEGALRTWNANVELTGTTDGTPTRLSIRAKDIRYDDAGHITLDGGSSLHVIQTIGDKERTFDMSPGTALFHSANWNDSQRDQDEWLRQVLTRNTTLPARVINAIIKGRQ